MPLIDKIAAQNRENTERIMKNAKDYVVSNNASGVPVETSMENTSAIRVINSIVNELVPACRSAVRDIDPTQYLEFIRLDTRKFEYLVAPEDEFTVVAVQECTRHITPNP